jgi:hypothetical protein
LLGLLASYKNKQEIKDEYGTTIVMFFNEDFVEEIIDLISKYRNSKLCKITDKLNTNGIQNGIVSIKNTIKFYKENYRFSVVKFVEYGQMRGKKWDYMRLTQYNEASNIIPKPKKKFINPKNRKRYVISK